MTAACPYCDGPMPCPRSLCAAYAKADTQKREAPTEQRAKTWRDGLVTARELQTKQFKPVRIIVPGLIPEGVTILAGKPKIGKSWLALDICMAVAGDRFVLGQTKPVQGDALYLALEDNQRRLKKRTDKILQDAVGSDHFEMHTEWKRVDQGGLADIREWCEAHPARRLIWIDTFVKIRPVAGKNEQAYGYDYRAIEGLQKLAGEYQIGIVLNHHLRKASSEDDPFDEVSGTLGITGAADTIVIMKRQDGMVKMFVRGRDIEEAEFAAEFDRATCRWRLVGEADEVFRSQQRQAILAALKDARRPMTITEIMAATDRHDRHAIQVLLLKMEKAGDVQHVRRGVWALPTGADPINSVDFGDFGDFRHQTFDDTEETGSDQSQRKVNGNRTGDFAGDFAKAANPLIRKEGAQKVNKVNEVNGSERSTPNGGNGSHPSSIMAAKVWISEIRPPALGPPGDCLEDFV